MDGFEKQKIIWNFCVFGKCLNRNDHFYKLSVQNKIFSRRILDHIIKDKKNPNLLETCQADFLKNLISCNT